MVEKVEDVAKMSAGPLLPDGTATFIVKNQTYPLVGYTEHCAFFSWINHILNVSDMSDIS